MVLTIYIYLKFCIERQNDADGAAEFMLKTVKVADQLFDKGAVG